MDGGTVCVCVCPRLPGIHPKERHTQDTSWQWERPPPCIGDTGGWDSHGIQVWLCRVVAAPGSQCSVLPGSIVPTTQRGLMSCSGIREPIRDTTACGRKPLAVLVPLRVRNTPAPLGCTFSICFVLFFFFPNSLTPNPNRLSPGLTSDSRIPARSRGRCGRCPAGRSAGSRIPRGARSPGLMLEPGAALQGTERGDFQPRC